MALFIAGLIIFFAIHHVRQLAPNVRLNAIERMGAMGWKVLFALLSLAGLVLIVLGWMQGRLDAPQIYDGPAWGRHAAYSLILLSFICHAAANLETGYIKQTLRHPFSVGMILWSVGHLLVNGDLFSVLLWGSFLVSSVWHILASVAANEPAPKALGWRGDAAAIIGGSAIYAVFALFIHGWLFGVAPF